MKYNTSIAYKIPVSFEVADVVGAGVLFAQLHLQNLKCITKQKLRTEITVQDTD